MRTLSTKAARKMASQRKSYGAGTGRPRIPTPCPKCGVGCKSYRLAQVHCMK